MVRGIVTLQTALRLLRSQLHGDAQNLIDGTIDELDRLEYVEAAAAEILADLSQGITEADHIILLQKKIAEGPRAGELLP